MECIHFQGADNSVIVKSKFLNCAQQDVSFQTQSGRSSINGLTIENNVFDAACSHPQPSDVCASRLGRDYHLHLQRARRDAGSRGVRFNSLNGSPSVEPQPSAP